ncbi:MAG: DUF389 domain-containing protein [Anaerolineales bacterium]|nr:DUF389 domain-containing protein [Anaerolineales bacterium]
MRQLIIQVPRGAGDDVTAAAAKYDPVNVARFTAVPPRGPQDVVILHVANHRVGALLDDLGRIPNGQITLNPHEVLTMRPPDEKVADSITEVRQRSPMEVWLNGLQSIGSWKSFLGYAVAAGIVVWIGLFTNTIYLLVAAMLIAPFGGPAMNVSLATASGDATLLRRSLLRYALGLVALMATAVLLTLLLRQQRITSLMMDVGQLSAVAALLPVVTGAIGAMNLIEPERNSLVPGTAVGLLVAASLAPPAGVAGIAVALQQWTLVLNAFFVLALQLVMINLAGALVFRYYGGLTSRGSRYQRGDARIFRVSLLISCLAAAGLLWLQFQTTPALQRSTRAQRAASEAEQVINDSDLVTFVTAAFRFTEPTQSAGETLLGTLYVQRRPGVTLPDAEIEARLVDQIQQRLLNQGFDVTPLVSITVLEAP